MKKKNNKNLCLYGHPTCECAKSFDTWKDFFTKEMLKKLRAIKKCWTTPVASSRPELEAVYAACAENLTEIIADMEKNNDEIQNCRTDRHSSQ